MTVCVVGDQEKRPAAKWAAVVNDTLVWMPNRVVQAAVLYDQAGIQIGEVLLRDANTPNDAVVPREGTTDLATGNVFYSVPLKEAPECTVSSLTPKLAVVVDDRWEIITKPVQSGRSIRNLFGLGEEVGLWRDLESPEDQEVGESESIEFAAGCVFKTRRVVAHLVIHVNRLRFTEQSGVKETMKGREIASLVDADPAHTVVKRVVDGREQPIGLDETVTIHNGDEFKVLRCNINAGFQSDRVNRELERLRGRGGKVTLVGNPPIAVIYHDVPAGSTMPIGATDVLVKIPVGYPGGIIDNAFLPEGSPLLPRTRGSAQQVEEIAGRRWQQKSIHPHTNGGIQWDKDRHGFDTYYSEIVSWLNS